MSLPKDCVYPDGSAAVDGVKGPRMVPCDANASVSSCCATNDTCIANGMCLSNALFLYRGACTSPFYPAGSCPQFCIKATDAGNTFSGFQPLSICQDLALNPVAGQKVFTCSTTSATCIHGNFSLPPSPVAATNLTGFASNTTCPVAVPVTKKSGVSTADLVAAVVVPIVVLVALGALLWYWEHRKRVKAEYEAKDWEDTAHRAETQMGAQVENAARSWENTTQTQMNGHGNGNATPGPGNLKRTGTEPFTVTTPLSELSGTGSPLSGKRAPW